VIRELGRALRKREQHPNKGQVASGEREKKIGKCKGIPTQRRGKLEGPGEKERRKQAEEKGLQKCPGSGKVERAFFSE